MDLTVLLMAAAGILYVAAIVFAIVQISRTSALNPIEKLIWIVAVICVPLIGSVIWLAAGPHPFGLRFGPSEPR